VGAVHLGTPVWQPGGEGGVQHATRGEAPAGQHVAADDLDLALHPPLRLGPAGSSQQIANP
jgi:hypothetical protein